MSHDEASLLTKLKKSHIPTHVAIIMDGNGRWARERHMPRLWGHREGTKSVHEVVEAAARVGIQVLTLYAFSTENWSRPQIEISGLMKLLKLTLNREEKNLNKNNIRLETIGDILRLPKDVQQELHRTQKVLSVNTGMRLVLALNYGGRQDIVQACEKIVKHGAKHVDEELLNSNLQTATYPDPDLLIRTSGEFRVSNFLLWQIAYAEIYITPTLWPDFRSAHFYRAILDYQSRERRFGALT